MICRSTEIRNLCELICFVCLVHFEFFKLSLSNVCVVCICLCVCDSSTSATHLISNNSPRFRFVTRNSNRNAKPFSEINSNELFRIILFVFFVMIFKENSSSCINTKWLHEFHFNSQRIAFESREKKTCQLFCPFSLFSTAVLDRVPQFASTAEPNFFEI